ncbi:hypothetical protein EDB81DRAFT_485609 [Dactylonectria macrodidyma]|uniref:PD-(D/E)XK nuclease-like domain-containing protein n=1 Tax=Dactylonectria macrodidyma TaxID=307937 RepID=A0A9P9J8F4_9HYPO|nr:hypothetical protein EDB81DRAFT_485609 [Dactylonectria macrodidyma]
MNLTSAALSLPTLPGEGSRLTPESVNIGSEARRCFEMDLDEPVWNVGVHQPLLKKLFRAREDRLINFSLWTNALLSTTAPIIKEYLPIPAPDKRIDFCLYIDSRHDPDHRSAAKAETRRQELPQTSINHTSYSALSSCPITVSLETNRSGNDFEGAVSQMAMWQAAHWKMLRSSVQKTEAARLGQD